MSRISKLKKNLKHEQAESTPFMQRMCHKLDGEKPSTVDCINLFGQYYLLYQAMEQRLEELAKDGEPLQFFTQAPWACRSQLLLEDIEDMKSYLTKEEQELLLPADFLAPPLSEFIERLKAADALTLLGCYLVRCLGDVFGGQHLAKYNQQCFGKRVLEGKFYNSVANRQMELGRYANSVTVGDEEAFFKVVDDVFDMHIGLFEVMQQNTVAPLIKREPAIKRSPEDESHGDTDALFLGQPTIDRRGAKRNNSSALCRYGMFAVGAFVLGTALVTTYLRASDEGNSYTP